MKKTTMELLYDEYVKHQIYLTYLSRTISNNFERMMAKADNEVIGVIQDLYQSFPSGLTVRSSRKLNEAIRQIAEIRNTAFDEAYNQVKSEFEKLSVAENEYNSLILALALPVVYKPKVLGGSHLMAIVKQLPIEGRTLDSWFKGIRISDVNNIVEAIRKGMFQQQSLADVLKRVRGTQEFGYRNGTLGTTYNYVESTVVTASNAVSNAVKREFYVANIKILSGEMFVAVLDNRTTAVCRGNDSKIFNVGVGPIPPLHYRCRSTRIPLVSGKALLPFEVKKEVQEVIFKEHEASGGDDLQAYTARRVRTLVGEIPKELTYDKWLRRQPKSVQDDILGIKKAELFRNNRIRLTSFVDYTGRELTLAQLYSRHKQAFEEAGIKT